MTGVQKSQLILRIAFVLSILQMASAGSSSGCVSDEMEICDQQFDASGHETPSSLKQRNCSDLSHRVQCLENYAAKCEAEVAYDPSLRKKMAQLRKMISSNCDEEKKDKPYDDSPVIPSDSTNPEKGCEQAEVEDCLKNVYPLMKNQPLSGLSANKEDLELACNVFKSGMSCIDDHAARCLQPNQREILDRKVLGARKVMTLVCNDKVKADHGHYNDCFRDLSSKISNCSVPLQKLRQRRPYHSKDDTVRDLCCAQRLFVDCVSAEASGICEPNAIDLAIRIIKAMYTHQLNQKCNNFAVTECSGSDAVHGHSRLRVVMVTVLLLLLRTVG